MSQFELLGPGDVIVVRFGLGSVRRLGLVVRTYVGRGGQHTASTYIYGKGRKSWTAKPRPVQRMNFVKLLGRSVHSTNFMGRAQDFLVNDTDPRTLTPFQVEAWLKELYPNE
jgi:hypothetical protein